MPAITVKNIPTDIYERLKKSASKNHRSINSEVITCLEKALSSNLIDPEEFLFSVNKLRESIKAPPLTDDILNKAKNEGRL